MVQALPALQSGDRLTRAEFERRYEAMPHLKKAELIDGVVYVASPASIDHAGPHALLITWLGFYAARVTGTSVYGNVTIRLDEDNEPQPDACLVRTGHPRDGKYFGAPPPLVAESAYSSAAYDLHQKKDVFRRHGCREYLVAVVHTREVFWFRNVEGTFVPIAPTADGVYRSIEFPGLWLDSRALFEGDAARLLATLEQGLATR